MWESYHHPRHSKRDSLSNREFELLLRGARKLDEHRSLQARFAIFMAGRLGMRKGEITHMTREWIDWKRNMICIPYHENCIKARDTMGICGYCRQSADQRLEHNPDLDREESETMQWVAKTEEAAREIPFDFHPRVSLLVDEFFEKWDAWPVSAQGVTRRVKKAAENVDLEKRVYPHALRATAASYHAARGLDVLPLQALMGWAQVSTAHNYVRASGENTARALNSVHSQ
jgi:integrase